MKRRLHRRDFLKLGALALPTLAASPFNVPASRPATLGRSGDPRKVIVVGAGLGGLAAAYELKQAGHAVTVLEAQLRAGGRVYSMRAPFSDGLYAEAGAVFIPDSQTLTLQYIDHFALPLYHFQPGDLRRIYYLDGKRFEETTYGESVDWPFALTPEERELGFFGMQVKYLAPIFDALGDPTDPAWPPEHLKPYDAMSFADFLRNQGASPGAVALLRLGFNDTWGEGIDSTSALFMLRSIASQMDALELYTLQGGNDLLPRAFAAQLRENIFYGAPVVRIEQNAQGVRAVFQQAGTYQSLEGDYLICAVPFSVLRHIEVDPPFSPEKRGVIEQLPYTSVARIFLQFRKKKWTDGPGAWSATDLPLMNICDSTFSQQGARGILSSFVVGREARRLTAMSEEERLRFTLQQMERTYPGISVYFEGGASKCWDEDPWARGGYSWFKPGQMTALSPHLARPEARVHFAGEHTSTRGGWMQGALESGNRAARAINDAP